MWGYTIIPDEEVKKMYPEGSSHMAILAHKAIADGYKVASIKNENFSHNLLLATRMSTAIIEANCFNRMKYVVDFSKMVNNEVIVAFDDKCNH